MVLAAAGILFFERGITGASIIEPITLGYCPTMKQVAEQLSANNDGMVLIEQPSSAQAIQELNNQNIDIALIGRLAEQSEIQSANERMLERGYTLVTNTKIFMQENELENIKVHTAIEEEIAKQMIPKSEIIFYPTTQEAVNKGLSEAVLIGWDDYKDEYELLVVMKGTQKVEDFRIPVLYSYSFNLEKLRIEN